MKKNGQAESGARRPVPAAKAKRATQEKAFRLESKKTVPAAVTKPKKVSARPPRQRVSSRKTNEADPIAKAAHDTTTLASMPVPPTVLATESKFRRIARHFGLKRGDMTKLASSINSVNTVSLESLAVKHPEWRGDASSKDEIPEHVRLFFKIAADCLPQHDYDQEGPQKWILNALVGAKKDAALERFEEAKLKSFTTCFLLVGELLFGKGWLQKTEVELTHTALLLEIRLALKNRRQLPDGGGTLRDPEFFERLPAEMRKWKEAKRDPLFTKENLFVIAHCWTHPLSPLWMMNARAAVDMVHYLKSDAGVPVLQRTGILEQANYDQIVLRAGLPRSEDMLPIIGAVFYKNKAFSKYEWASWAKGLLKL